MIRRLLDSRTVTLAAMAAGLFVVYREVHRARLVAEDALVAAR